MNPVLLSIILIPVLEIYLFIKIGTQIGAFNTILLIFITAIVGVYYAKYEGLNTIKSGFMQVILYLYIRNYSSWSKCNYYVD